jgi:hypothetical protein
MLIGCGGNSSNGEKKNSLYKPDNKTTWHWQLNGDINTNHNVELYDIDLFDTDEKIIKELKDSGKKVICYFSAGSFENWRDDKDKFPASVKGSSLDGWEGENWLDIRSSKVKDIMSARIKLAKDKGCDGVEPDNVDGYTNNSGFDLTYEDQIAFNRFLASESHRYGLSIALKNDLDQIVDLEPYFDFAVNESCHKYSECDMLKPFTDHNKAVLNAEYEVDKKDEYCSNSFGFSMLFLPRGLDDSFRYSCK